MQVQPIQIWLHPLGICKTSKKNMLIRSELHEENITMLIHEKKQLLMANRASSEPETCNPFERKECGITLVIVL
jgi:hypothetical protein